MIKHLTLNTQRSRKKASFLTSYGTTTFKIKKNLKIMLHTLFGNFQRIGFAKQVGIDGCHPAIPALPPLVVHSVPTEFRRFKSFDTTPVRSCTLTADFANIICVQ
jgi:hypothetical protein